MPKHRPSPSKAAGRKRQFEKLLETMGMGKVNPYIRYPLTQRLEEIERDYARQVAVSGKQPDRKLVRQYRGTITKLLTLSETIGPDFFANEIEKAGWCRLNPDADERTLNIQMEDYSSKRDDLIPALTARRLDADHWLKTSGNTYKKRDLRKVVVEPFLQLMAEHKITTSRKQRPRKQIFDALFDWLGVEPKFRPSSANIDAIARELEGSVSASKSNAKRRSKN
jgi:hypothetical protein